MIEQDWKDYEHDDESDSSSSNHYDDDEVLMHSSKNDNDSEAYILNRRTLTDDFVLEAYDQKEY